MRVKLTVFYLLVLLTFIITETKSQNSGKLFEEEFNFPILPGSSSDNIFTIRRTDFLITLRDSIRIDAVKFVPVAAIPPGGWPTVIMVHGYGSRKETLVPIARSQAQLGYYVLTFSVRGQGNSGGLSNLISRTEAQDLIEIVNYVKKDTASGSNPSKIIIEGGSQGGLLPFMAACIGGLNVKTIISALAPPDFASSWIENGSIKTTFMWSVNYHANIVRYNQLVGRMADWVFANNKEKWDSLAYWLPVDRNFMNIVNNNTIPLIIEGCWQDKFFNGSGIIQASSLLTVPYRMYLGAVGGHGGEPSPEENIWHQQFIADWYNYWIFDVQNGTLNAPKYQYASTTHPVVNNVWTFVHDSSTVWPRSDASNYRLYFTRKRILSPFPNPVRGDDVALLNQVTGGLTMLEAINLGFKDSVFNSKFLRSSSMFETGVLTQDIKMTGVPVINMEYSSTAGPFAQFNFQIYEVKPDGSQRLVNRINYTDRNVTPNTKKIVSVNGQAHSHIFKAGNMIRIILTNLDSSPDDPALLEGNPFVLPVLANSTNYLYLSNDSYIDIPVTGFVPDAADNIGNENFGITGRYELEQNYPNPFNPSTTISFNIAKADLVTLKVYDVTGREIKTLVNEILPQGKHRVTFDAGNIASGVYFIKLITESGFNATQKIILMK